MFQDVNGLDPQMDVGVTHVATEQNVDLNGLFDEQMDVGVTDNSGINVDLNGLFDEQMDVGVTDNSRIVDLNCSFVEEMDDDVITVKSRHLSSPYTTPPPTTPRRAKKCRPRSRIYKSKIQSLFGPDGCELQLEPWREHLDVWVLYLWHFRPEDADWVMVGPYFSTKLLSRDIPMYYANGITYGVPWFAPNVEKDLTLQRWFCEKRQKYQDATPGDLSDWASAKVKDRMFKSANWTMDAIEHGRIYEVDDRRNKHIVRLDYDTCTCRKWQLSGLPCGHAIAVCRVQGLTSCNHLAKGWFRTTNLKATYQGLVYPVGEISSWELPTDLQAVKPQNIDKHQAGRPKNRDRIRSQGEVQEENTCGRCSVRGHNRGVCNAPFP